MKTRILLLVAALSLTGCAATGSPPGPGVAVTESPAEQRYRATGYVIEDATHGPQLCEIATLSLVPQCDGLDLAGWSWDAVQHTARDGSRYGRFEVTGTFDGTRLTVTEPPGPPRAESDRESHDFTSPCPAPAGGWRVVDGRKATDAALQRALALVDSTRDGAGSWVDLRDGDDTNDPRTLILNVRSTGDLAALEQRLRGVWGGALCVLPANHSTAELNRIRSELTESLPGVIQDGTNVMRNNVTIKLYVATEAVRREVEARYGPDVVKLDPYLKPV